MFVILVRAYLGKKVSVTLITSLVVNNNYLYTQYIMHDHNMTWSTDKMVHFLYRINYRHLCMQLHTVVQLMNGLTTYVRTQQKYGNSVYSYMNLSMYMQHYIYVYTSIITQNCINYKQTSQLERFKYTTITNVGMTISSIIIRTWLL